MDRFDSAQLIKLIWSHSTDGLIIFEWDEDRQDLRVLKLNRVARDLTSGTLQEGTLLCEALPVHLEINDSVGMPLIDYYRSVIDSGQEKTAVFNVLDSPVKGWWQNKSVPFFEDGTECLFMSFRNVTSIMEASQRFEAQANTDALTGIPNRRQFDGDIEEWVRTKSHFTCVFVDLNHFKALNDTYGHLEADRVLQVVAHRLNECLLPVCSLVFRISGDEFFLLWDCDLSPTEIGDRVYSGIHQPITIGPSLEVDVSAAIGIVEYKPGLTADALMKGADEQMYRSKRRECPYCILRDWDSALYRIADELRLEIQSTKRLRLHYQPIYDLSNGTIASWEALIRWPHPDRTITADTIIEAVRSYGLNAPFCLWTIQRAQRDWRSWGCPSQSVAVNVSPSWLENDAIFDALMASEGLAVEVLEDERLESLLVLQRISQLRDNCIPVYVDDFGKAYSSLGQVSRIMPDKVKVDMVIIQDERLAAGVGALMQTLKIPSVAEGIDSDERLQAIRDAGYTYGQGYRLMMPRSAEEVRAIVGI